MNGRAATAPLRAHATWAGVGALAALGLLLTFAMGSAAVFPVGPGLQSLMVIGPGFGLLVIAATMAHDRGTGRTFAAALLATLFGVAIGLAAGFQGGAVAGAYCGLTAAYIGVQIPYLRRRPPADDNGTAMGKDSRKAGPIHPNA